MVDIDRHKWQKHESTTLKYFLYQGKMIVYGKGPGHNQFAGLYKNHIPRSEVDEAEAVATY